MGASDDPVVELGRHQDAWKPRRSIPYRLENPETIEPGHVHIEQGQMNPAMFDHLERLDAVGSQLSTKTLPRQGISQGRAKIFVVVGNQ